MSIKLFLSHASEDKPEVRQLYDRLSASGFEVWLDEVELVPGQNWRDVIQREVADADFFLACLTSNTDKPGFVREEFRHAMANYRKRGNRPIYLIPVMLEPCDIPDVSNDADDVNLRDFHLLEYWRGNWFSRLLQIIKEQINYVLFSDWLKKPLQACACASIIFRERGNSLPSDPSLGSLVRPPLEFFRNSDGLKFVERLLWGGCQ